MIASARLCNHSKHMLLVVRKADIFICEDGSESSDKVLTANFPRLLMPEAYIGRGCLHNAVVHLLDDKVIQTSPLPTWRNANFTHR